MWNTWMGLIEPYASKLPYHVSIGNHECVALMRGAAPRRPPRRIHRAYPKSAHHLPLASFSLNRSCSRYDYEGPSHGLDPSGSPQLWHPAWANSGSDSGGECGVGTDRRFRMPASNGSNGVFWYSFSVGNVHVAMISSEHDPSPSAPMGSWLVRDLAAVDRSQTPWVFVGIHRPLVETEKYESDYVVAQHLFAIMNPYLLEYGVDVVAAGHYHSFQRSCFVGAQYSCVKGGPGNGAQSGIVHYTSGAAGASLDEVGLYDDPVIEQTLLGVYGYSVVDAPNSTALRLTFFRNQDNAIIDDVWIHKAPAA